MTHDRRFRVYTLFLGVLAAVTIWIVGSGEATPHREALWAQADRQPLDTDRGPSTSGASRETLYKYSKLLTDISYRIQSAYMDTINTKEMIYSGIRGMLDVLDPFSVLMEQQNYDRLPEFAQSTTQMLATSSQEVRDVDSRIQALNQQIGYLDAQLTPALHEPFAGGDHAGEHATALGEDLLPVEEPPLVREHAPGALPRHSAR